MSDPLLELQPRFSRLVARPSSDHLSMQCQQEDLLSLLAVLKKEYDYQMLMDVTAVDWETESPRFTVIYHLYSLSAHRYLRVAVDCPSDEKPAVPSVTTLFPAADWHERETYDMFGIQFEGHPDLRRILMWDKYPYYPLRKEFPLAGIETDLPDAEVSAETGAGVIAAPMMGGPFVAETGKAMSRSEPRAKDQSWTERHNKPITDESPGSK